MSAAKVIRLHRRQRGQSLVDYLMSNQSGKVGPELDRENAHFSVSEAMIAAIEEVNQCSFIYFLKCENACLLCSFLFRSRRDFKNGKEGWRKKKTNSF